MEMCRALCTTWHRLARRHAEFSPNVRKRPSVGQFSYTALGYGLLFKSCASYGVDSVWGDRKGTLAARRRLLNPALRSFAAARSDDVCILWTGRAGCVEALEERTGPEVPTKGIVVCKDGFSFVL
eukprot:s2394_g4.t1